MATGITIGGTSTFATNQILQIVTGTHTTETATASSTFVTTNLSVSITPKLSSSKILVIVAGNAHYDGGSTAAYLSIFRDSTNLGNSSTGFAGVVTGNTDQVSMIVYDSPATTSAITYAAYMRSVGGAISIRMPYDVAGQGVPTNTIVAIEIAQ